MPQIESNNPVSLYLERLNVSQEESGVIRELEKILGQRLEVIPGDLVPDAESVEFTPGELTEEKVIEEMVKLVKDGKFETLSELSRYEQLDSILHSLQALRAVNASTTTEERQQHGLEFSLANQSKTLHEYSPELVRLLVGMHKRAKDMKRLADQLGLRPLVDVKNDMANGDVLMMRLKEEIKRRTAFASFATTEKQMHLQQQIPEIDRKAGTSQEWKYLQKWVDALGLRSVSSSDLLEQRDKAFQELSDSDKAVAQQIMRSASLEQRNDAIMVHATAINNDLHALLQGRKDAIGIQEDFYPQLLYTKLSSHIDRETHDTQKWITEKIARDSENKEVADLQQYIINVRSTLDADTADFTHDLGVYQLRLDEIVRVQNMFGKDLNIAGASPGRLQLSQETQDTYVEWLETRKSYRQGQIREALNTAEEMLVVRIDEKLEHEWNTSGRVFVTELADKLADIASSWMPSEKQEGIVSGVYRGLGPLLGFPKSREAQKQKLVGPIKEQLGWSQDKSWDELTPEEKSQILENCKSVLKAKQNFERSSIVNLRNTMDVIDQFPSATEFQNQRVDEELIRIVERQIESENRRRGQQGNPEEFRIDRNMAGEIIDGQTVNPATAFVLLLRQRRREWGSIEEGEGFSGQYAQYLRRLEGVIQQHFDVGQAIFEMQHAWEEYALNVAKLAGIAGVSPMIIAAIVAVAPQVLYYGSRFAFRTLPRGARLAGRLSQLPETSRTVRATREALTKMRYMNWERQVSSYLESSRAGRFVTGSRAFQRLSSSTRFAGGAVSKMAWVAIPAVAAYDSYTIHLRVQDAQDNEQLRREYKSEYGIVAGESGLYAISLFAGPLALVTIPTTWAVSEMKRGTSERRANWNRTAADWTREFEGDSAGLLQRLEEIAPGQEVGVSGYKGGGAYKSRLGQWRDSILQWKRPSDQQREAVEMVSKGNQGSRMEVYESYFLQNLLTPEGISHEHATEMVQRKVAYISALTHGGMERVSAMNRSNADVYVQLCELHDAMVKAHTLPVFSFVNMEGEEEHIDLADLFSESRTDALRVVGRYVSDVLPAQELVLFNTIGEAARTERNPKVAQESWSDAQRKIRKALFMKLLHFIHDAEQTIRKVDWPGVDVPGVSFANEQSANLARSYLAAQLDSTITQAVQQLLQGNWSLERYEKFLRHCEILCVEVRDKTRNYLYINEAKQYFDSPEKQAAASTVAENPLYRFFEE